jgi:hypothetical protein
MPTTVRLDRNTETLMNRLARRTGRSKSQVIRDAIAQLADTEGAAAVPTSAYEAMEHALGCWDSGGARLSERTGERFRALLQRRGTARDTSARAPARRRRSRQV